MNQFNFSLKFGFALVVASLVSPQVILGDGSRKEIDDSKKPNIIFILADDSGFSDLGCYGGEIATPNLDGLAAGGLRYTEFYNTGRCWPTRAALMTGYYPHQVHRDALPRARGGGRGKRQVWARMLPDFLRPHGYRSYHSGKWHLDGKCLDAGFDRSLNLRNHGNFFSARGNQIDDQPISAAHDEGEYYATTATVDHALECLKDHSANHSDKPFFHFVAFIAPHFPLHAKPEDIAKYKNRYQEGWDELRKQRFAKQNELELFNHSWGPQIDGASIPQTTTLSELEPEVGPPYHHPEALENLGPGEINRPIPWDSLTDQQKQFQSKKMAIHAAMVDRMDQEIGRLIVQLKEMRQFDNTLVMYSSDNGASAEIMVRDGGHDPEASPGSAASYLCLGPGFSSACNTPFRRHKTWVHEGGIATQLIAHWPAGIAARGEFRRNLGHMIDIVPTILEVAGIEKPAAWEGESIPAAPGQSLVPTFTDKSNALRAAPLFWLHGGHRAIRHNNLKLVSAKGDPWELYDLSKDRAESNNLTSGMPDQTQRLEASWQGMVDEFTELAKKTLDQKPKARKKGR